MLPSQLGGGFGWFETYLYCLIHSGPILFAVSGPWDIEILVKSWVKPSLFLSASFCFCFFLFQAAASFQLFLFSLSVFLCCSCSSAVFEILLQLRSKKGIG